jgi:hypothetical protein
MSPKTNYFSYQIVTRVSVIDQLKVDQDRVVGLVEGRLVVGEHDVVRPKCCMITDFGPIRGKNFLKFTKSLRGTE